MLADGRATICTFRRRNFEAVAEAFVGVLELAREMKLLKLGCVSIDGTHIRASASKDKNVTCERACQLREQLRLDVGELLAQAESAEYEGKVAARAQREGSAKGPEPKPPADTPEPCEQINLTAADARLMRKSKREGYTQSCNAQALLDADGSQRIVGQRVSTCASDAGELEADLESIPQRLGRPGGGLADCGYADKEVIARVGRDRPELDLSVSVHREDARRERRYDFRPLDKIKAPKTITDPVLVAMAEKLKTPEGKATCRRRNRPPRRGKSPQRSSPTGS